MIRSRRGVALLLTLVVTFFLVVLLGAFLIVNRGNNSLTVSGLKRQHAYNACMSGLHYVWGELELNQAWGVGGFPNGVRTYNYPAASPKIILKVHGDPDSPDDLSKNFIEGEFVGSSETFEIKLVNNLHNRNILEDTELGKVPGRSSRIKVTGYSSGLSLSLDSVLRKKPFVDYSALSSDDMSVELKDGTGDDRAWRLRSKDPYINQVRSNAEIFGPSAIDNELAFKEPPRGGVAKATTDIELDGTSVQSDPDFLAQSQVTSKGTFQVGTAAIDVPGLKKDDLRFPTETISVPAGNLQMRALEKHQWTSKNFQIDTSFPPDGILDTTVTRWRLEKFQHQAIQHNSSVWVSDTSFPLEDSGTLDLPTDGVDSPNSSNGFQDVPTQPTALQDVVVLYGDDPQHQMKANLLTGDIALTAGTKFEVQGDLRIEQETDANQANLLFGYQMNSNGESEFSAKQIGGSAIEEPEANSAALVASGSLLIDGIATGFGSIFADRSVDLRAKSGLRAEPDMAVAVHGETIHFAAEEPPDGTATNRLLETDWDLFKGAMNDTGFQNFEGWHELESRQTRPRVGDDPDVNSGLRSRSVEKNASEIWAMLDAELGLGSTPNFGSSPFGPEWNGQLSLDQYIRLREYAKSDSQAWLDIPGTKFQSVVSLIDQQVGTYSRWSSMMGLPMEDYMAADKAELADVFFVGLVHAGPGGFRASTNGASLLVEGSVVSQGVIDIDDAPSVDFVYNRLYLDDVVREFRGEAIKLDQVYFKLN